MDQIKSITYYDLLSTLQKQLIIEDYILTYQEALTDGNIKRIINSRVLKEKFYDENYYDDGSDLYYLKFIDYSDIFFKTKNKELFYFNANGHIANLLILNENIKEMDFNFVVGLYNNWEVVKYYNPKWQHFMRESEIL